jgi:hypothetical protein
MSGVSFRPFNPVDCFPFPYSIPLLQPDGWEFRVVPRTGNSFPKKSLAGLVSRGFRKAFGHPEKEEN